jgi:hypothetical protein
LKSLGIAVVSEMRNRSNVERPKLVVEAFKIVNEGTHELLLIGRIFWTIILVNFLKYVIIH